MHSELVGRDEELAAVDEFLAAKSGVLLLEGEAGIGKTRVWDAARVLVDALYVDLTLPQTTVKGEKPQLEFEAADLHGVL